MQLELQQRVAEIGAEHEERAVRQIRNSHQAENQREARRQQEQQAAEGHAVQRLDDPELPLHLWSAPGLQSPLVPAKAGTQFILDSRFRGNERRLNGDFVALDKAGRHARDKRGHDG